MPVRTHAQDEHIERGGELAAVVGGGRIQIAAFALDAVNARLRNRHMRQQGLHRHPVVALGVIAWNGALVAEIDFDPVPVDPACQVRRRERGVHRAGGRASGQRDRAMPAGREDPGHRLSQPLGGPPGK